MIFKPLAFSLLSSLMAACQVAEAPMSLGGFDACGASTLQYFIDQYRTVFLTVRIESSVQELSPIYVMTIDFNPRRLNIMFDVDGIIDVVRCG